MGKIEASYTVEIDAPLQRVYDVAADVPGAEEWNPAMQNVQVRETDDQGRATLIETEGDVKIKTVKSTLRFDYNEPDGMTWKQEKGDVKSVDGRWEFEDLGNDRTRATYGLEVDLGRVLSMLARGPVVDQIKDLLTKGAAEGIKKHIESGA